MQYSYNLLLNGEMEKIVISIVIIFFWIGYAVGEGMREAYYYDSEMRTDRPHKNIHWLYFLQRGIVLLIIGVTLQTILLPIGLAFIFPLIHDGCYYIQRNDLDPRIYPKRFKDDSTRSNAYFELGFVERIIFTITGILSFTAYFLLILFC